MYSLVFHLSKHAYRFNCFLYNFCTLDSFDNLSSTDCDDVKPSSHVLASPGNDLYSVKKGINRLFSKAVRVISKKLFLLILFCFACFFFLRTCYEKYVICNLSRRQNTNIGVQTFSSKTVKFSHQWKRNLVFLSK